MRNKSGIYMLIAMAAFVVSVVIYVQFFHDPEKVEIQEVFGASEPTQEQLESRLLALQVSLAEKEDRAKEALRRGDDIASGNAENILAEARRGYDRAVELAKKVARARNFQLDRDLLMPSSAIAAK